MKYEEFCDAIQSALNRAGITRTPFLEYDEEKGQYIGKAGEFLFLGRPTSRKIAVKRPNHDMMVWNLA